LRKQNIKGDRVTAPTFRKGCSRQVCATSLDAGITLSWWGKCVLILTADDLDDDDNDDNV